MEPPGAHWRASTYSGANNECVAVAELGAWGAGHQGPEGPDIAVRGEAFSAAVTALRAGTL